MKKYIFFILLLLIVGTNNVFALDPACTVAEQNRLRKLASQVYITYGLSKVELEGGGYSTGYDVYVSGLTKDFYIYGEDGTFFMSEDGTVATERGFEPGTSILFPFFASEKGPCRGFQITSRYITLPDYNYYSEESICEGNEEFELCNPMISIDNMDYEIFLKRVEKYAKSKKTEQEKKEEIIIPSTENLINQVVDFISNYSYYIFLPIIVGGVFGIIIIKLKERKEMI